MSVHVSSSLWDHSEHSGADLLILLAMADQCRDEGLCWMAVSTIGERTRLSRATVQRRLRALEEAGALLLVAAPPHKPRTYFIVTPRTAPHDPRNGGPQIEAPQIEAPHLVREGPHLVLGGASAVRHNTKDTSMTRVAAAAAPDDSEPPKAPKRGTRISSVLVDGDFPITETMAKWGAKNAPDVDGATQTAQFVDHWTAASGSPATKVDWTAAWRTWMRNAQERAVRFAPRAQQQPRREPYRGQVQR